MAEEIPDLAKRLQLPIRIGVRGFARASGILQVFVVQPKYRIVTDRNREIIEQLDQNNKKTFARISGQPQTLIHTYVTGTRQDTGRLERPQRTGMMSYLRFPGATLVPITYSQERKGIKRVLKVNLGSLINYEKVRRFEFSHQWTPKIIAEEGWIDKDRLFTSDDALMALIAQTTVLPHQKSDVEPKGIYKKENYQEKH